MDNKKTIVGMVEKFQCHGCVCGSSTKDDCYKLVEECGMFHCGRHVPGTNIMGIGSIYLGLPKGFNRVGMRNEALFRSRNSKVERGESHNIRLWGKPPKGLWDKFNVPVWAMEYEGHLLVRTYSPRINRTSIDIVKDGTLDLVPKAINVGEFADEID